MRLLHIVPLLGVAQIISWGTLYYTLGVLATPIARDTEVSSVFLFGVFSGSLLISGLLAPAVGRQIDRHGGRRVLSMGSALAALAMGLLALAQGPILIVLAWIAAGAAMSATLYDPAFATLNKLSVTHYRKAVTSLTLFGGFASTVFWPLTHFLSAEMGWRETLWLYAALHLFLCLPIHFLALRARGTNVPAEIHSPPAAVKPANPDATVRWLMVAFAGASFIVAVVGVHMITLLTLSGLTAAEAVLIGMLMGPMQVAGRLIELGFFSKVRSATVGMAAFGLLLGGVLCLLLTDRMGLAALLFVTAYGMGNGVLTIVRGTAPAELLGRDRLGALLGRLSRPAMMAKSIAPGAFSAIIAAGMTRNGAVITLAMVLALAWICFAMAARSAREQHAAVTISSSP